MTVVTSQAER